MSLNSTVEQNFQLHTPAYIQEMFKNTYPAYRINNIIPFSGSARSGTNTVTTERDGIVSFYLGWHTLGRWNILDYDTWMVGGPRMINDDLGRNNGTLYADTLNDGFDKFYQWYGLVSSLILPSAAAKIWAWTFVGWKIDCYRMSSLVAGGEITFSFLSPDTDEFTSARSLATPQPDKVVSMTANTVITANYIANILLTFKVPIIVPFSDFADEYTVTFGSISSALISAVDDGAGNWFVTVDCQPTETVHVQELLWTVGAKTGATTVICGNPDTLLYTRRTEPAMFDHVGQRFWNSQDYALPLENYVVSNLGGVIWETNGQWLTLNTEEAC